MQLLYGEKVVNVPSFKINRLKKTKYQWKNKLSFLFKGNILPLRWLFLLAFLHQYCLVTLNWGELVSLYLPNLDFTCWKLAKKVADGNQVIPGHFNFMPVAMCHESCWIMWPFGHCDSHKYKGHCMSHLNGHWMVICWGLSMLLKVKVFPV